MGNPNQIDLGGMTLVCNAVNTGASTPGMTGTALASAADSAFLTGAAAANSGTSKAMITGTSGALTIAGAVAVNGAATLGEAINIVAGTSTGSKIGTATAQKLGFWNATPVIQQASALQAAVTPSSSFTGADTVDKATVLAAVQAVEVLVNKLRLDLVTTGIIKGAA